MKIAVLVTHWKKTRGTGVTRYVINLVEELKKNSDLEIFILYRYGDDPENYKIAGPKYTFPFKAIQILNKLQPDIVYTDTNWYFLLTGVIFKRLSGAKLITTMHSHPSRLPFIGKILMQNLLNSCDIITYVSKDLQKKVRLIWDVQFRTREEITYAGVRSQSVTDKDIKSFIKKYNIPKNSFVLLMQSSPIAKVKADGTKILMQSVQELLPVYPEVLLILTGDGPYLAELEEYAVALGIQDKVIFTGWTNNPFVSLHICDLYTHITLGEGGLSLAVLEAMAMGKPIIATPVGGIPEAVENSKSGILVEADVEAVTGAITNLLCDVELRTVLGSNAHKRARDFSWEHCADKFSMLFK
jgi:glycosyltransferase involved in cell wall biosynthesis